MVVGRMESCCLVGREAQFCRMEGILETGCIIT